MSPGTARGVLLACALLCALAAGAKEREATTACFGALGIPQTNNDLAAGSIDADSGEKMTRFVDFCDTFHLPVLNFVDNPGFLIGPDAERAGTIRRGATAIFAVYQATVPWCSILLRRVFGG